MVVAGLAVLLLAGFSLGRSALTARREARDEARTAVAAQNAGRVVVYTTSSCGACKMAKAWMKNNNVAYVERSIDTDPTAHAELAKIATGRIVVPTFLVEDEVLAGFDPQGIRLTQAMQKHGMR
jgi:glutaredoxin